MSIRNLDAVFRPQSVALIGASRKAGSVGKLIARNLFHAGFEGPILPVHPRERAIEGVLAYESVADLPFAPDLAVIATPPDMVPNLVAQLGARGTRGAIVVTAGFGEGSDRAGKQRAQAVLDAARPYTLRVVGPNCIGVMVPGIGLNASFAHLTPHKGDLAFVAQSGAMATAMLDWATPRGIGFSHVVSLGGMLDVDFGDVLDALGRDPNTRAILLYVEAITQARKFMSAARATARSKPIIVIKGGRFAEGAQAARSHTGALAGSDAVFDTAFRRAGILRVYDMDELFDAAQTLAHAQRVRGDRMAILTNGGGLGVLATDALVGGGGRLAELSQDTYAKLNQVLPPTWSHGNPVDIIGDAPGKRYSQALATLMADANTDAVLVLNCPVAVADSREAARAVNDTLSRGRRKPVLTSWLGDGAARAGRQLFADNGIPSYATPENAVRGFLHLVRFKRGQDELMETPPSIPDHWEPDREAAMRPIHAALQTGESWLSETESKTVLAAYGVPVVETRFAAGIEAAVAAADAIGYPVGLKIVSPDITHKSEVGGVELELEDADRLRRAGERILKRAGERRPDARISGFSVQQMVRRANGHELIIGASTDPVFGPVLLFGHGGTAVEVRNDQSLALPPLNMTLARNMMADTRVYRLLQGYRDQPPVDLDGIAVALINLSQLIADVPEIAEVDVNPLLASPEAVIGMDARIKVTKPALNGTSRLAIRPYPRHLESRTHTHDGTEVFLRPVRPEDEPALVAFYEHMDPEDVRMRFSTRVKSLSHRQAAQLTQIDYDREMAFVAQDGTGQDDGLWGIVRLACDPDNLTGEYAVAVRSDMKGCGLGYLLMQHIIAHARDRGLGMIQGDVLVENRDMLDMCKELEFQEERNADDPEVVRVRLPLQPQAA